METIDHALASREGLGDIVKNGSQDQNKTSYRREVPLLQGLIGLGEDHIGVHEYIALGMPFWVLGGLLETLE